MNEPLSRFSRAGALAASAFLLLGGAALGAACGNSDDSSDNGSDGGGGSGTDASSGGGGGGGNDSGTTGGGSDSGTGTGTDGGGGTKADGGGGTRSDGGGGGACGAATLYAGNPTFADPGMRPADGANILTGTPFLYERFQFVTGGILVNDQRAVWRIDTATSLLHAVAGGALTSDPELLAAASPGVACASAHFGSISSTVLDSQGNLFVSDYTNAILKVSNPLNAATCMVSYFAGTAMEVDSPNLDQTDGNSGTADGTGAAAQFLGPQYLTIDSSDNLYVLDHGTAWSIRKITPTGAVTTLARFTVDTYAYGELQFLGGKVYFWARGNDTGDADTANLIAIDPTATTAVQDPPSVLTLHGEDLGGDSASSFETGGITTDGTKLYVEALGQIFSVNVTGTTPVLSAPLAGENDDNWSEQTDLDFATGYDPTAAQTSSSVELLSLDNTQTIGVSSYLSRDSAGNLYFRGNSDDVFVEKIAGCP